LLWREHGPTRGLVHGKGALLLEVLSAGKSDLEKSEGTRTGFIFKLYFVKVPYTNHMGKLMEGRIVAK
jgi:hypothetical protein